jgi:hypothetical protein
VHPAATVPPLEPATSAFAMGIPSTAGVSTVPVWGAIPPTSQPVYPLAYPYPLPPMRIPVPEPYRFKAQTMLEWNAWKRAYKDQFRNNPAYFLDDASKVNWSLTYLDAGPRDFLETYFIIRRFRAIT